MSMAATIREKLAAELFRPFRVRAGSGDAYVVHNPDLAVVIKSELFVAQPNSDRHAIIPFLRVAAVESIDRGNGSRRKKK